MARVGAAKEGSEDREIEINMTLPRSKRPMIGFDIEQWRGQNRLSKYDAQCALGFRNSNHYNLMCRKKLLDPAVELLIRIYDEFPSARGWEKYTLLELFEVMYGPAMRPFKGKAMEKAARVDLANRFCKLFDRTGSRQYQWLKESETRNDDAIAAYAIVQCLLSKLVLVNDPKDVLERNAKIVWKLRGVDLDTEFPIPTLKNPPHRRKTGRPPRTPAQAAAAKRAKAKKKAQESAAAKKAKAEALAKAQESAKSVRPVGTKRVAVKKPRAAAKKSVKAVAKKVVKRAASRAQAASGPVAKQGAGNGHA